MTFPTTGAAVRAEAFFKNKGIKFIVIPAPRSIDSDCGMALEFETYFETRVREFLNEETNRIQGTIHKDYRR